MTMQGMTAERDASGDARREPRGAERIGVLGLGYVGLPLTVALARKFDVVGFDIDAARAEALSRGEDKTGEIDLAELRRTTARFTADPEALRGVTTFIVAAPTPIDRQPPRRRSWGRAGHASRHGRRIRRHLVPVSRPLSARLHPLAHHQLPRRRSGRPDDRSTRAASRSAPARTSTTRPRRR